MQARTTFTLQQLETRDVPSTVVENSTALPPHGGMTTPTEASASNNADVPPVGQALRTLPRGRYAVGSGIRQQTQVNVYDAKTNAMIGTLTPFGRAFTGGARVATGDINGDGVEDVIVAAGSGGGPAVKVFDGITLRELRSFYAYDSRFSGGVYVAVGDVTGDGRADIITGAGNGGSPHVNVFSGKALFPTGDVKAAVEPYAQKSFYAFSSTLRGGVTVAAGDVNGDGRTDIVVGAGPGGPPQVKVFSGTTGATLQTFNRANSWERGGVFVAAGDLDGDGKAEVLTGSGQGGEPVVRVYRDGRQVSAIRAWNTTDTRGLRVAARDLDGDGKAEILATSGSGGAPRVKVLNALTRTTIREFPAMMPSYTGGLFVG